MSQDVEEPREIPVMGDLLLGLDPEESLQRGIAADFGEPTTDKGAVKDMREYLRSVGVAP